MAAMSNENTLLAVLTVPGHFHMDLCHQRTSSIEYFKAASVGLGANCLGHSMGRKNYDAIVRNLIEFLDKYCPSFPQVINYKFIVDYLMPNVDGSAKHVQRTIDDINSAIDARAKTTGVGKLNIH
jgi:hypothetical protein